MSQSRKSKVDIHLDMHSFFGQCHLKGEGSITNNSIKADELKLQHGSFGCPSSIRDINIAYSVKSPALFASEINMDTPFGKAHAKSDIVLSDSLDSLNNSNASVKFKMKDPLLQTAFSGTIKQKS